MRRNAAGLLAVAIGPLGWCFSIAAVVGGDPMLALETVGTAVAVVWAMLVARELARSARTSRALAAAARPAELFGVAIRITHLLRTDAVVVGTLRPRIYVGSELLECLADDEVLAVLLHEDYHRRTRAPLRAAALGAWLRLFGRSLRLRAVILNRLTDLETLADADAIRRGSSPRSLARALLKGDMSLQPVSFGYAAERRVAQLLDRAGGHPVSPPGRLPYELLPVIVLVIASVGCHAGL